MVPVVRLIGVPIDCHSSYMRCAASAPAAIRAALDSAHGNSVAESGVELGLDVRVDDWGDLALSDTLAATAADDGLVFAAVTDALAAGAMPLVLGGDHSISVPVVAALAGTFGALNILHIDAHPDLYEIYGGDPRSHASPFARIVEAGHAKRLVQVGVRTMNRHCREQALRFGVEVIEMRDFRRTTLPALEGPLYISIDMDGFDPGVAPGVAHLEPGGLSVRDVLDLMDRQTAPLVGADIVELCPVRDPTGVTSILAAKLVRELCALHMKNGAAT